MKTPEQERRALEQRRANADAKREGRPMPFPNPWDTWDPTKVPTGASDEETLQSYREFSKICRKKKPKRLKI